MQGTVVITTKNRRDDLRKAVQSAVEQTARPQVLVIDDGSTDGTSDMVRSEFPQVMLHRDEQSRGLIVQRNQGARLASGDVIFSIDDDAAFSSPHTVEQTLGEFDHPRVGAVAIPFLNVNKENKLMQRAPGEAGIYVPFEYIGTAHAVLRSIFLQLHGYRAQLFHQGEESDYCVRLLNSGHVVRLGRADPIHHYESPRRDFRRMDLYGRRNDILFAVHNVPFPYLPVHLLMTSAQGVKFGFITGRPLRMMHGLAMGWLASAREIANRQPVDPKVYRLIRRLRRAGMLELCEIEADLPPMAEAGLGRPSA
jgi:glycosyltransferase involved in cell wall biosynthesis